MFTGNGYYLAFKKRFISILAHIFEMKKYSFKICDFSISYI